ncbi:hypothetical protein G7046_g960 [Stylonectria norvegica]|nr:hypothetical protein G7046_g960 [Stylonectria norvegica]
MDLAGRRERNAGSPPGNLLKSSASLKPSWESLRTARQTDATSRAAMASQEDHDSAEVAHEHLSPENGEEEEELETESEGEHTSVEDDPNHEDVASFDNNSSISIALSVATDTDVDSALGDDVVRPDSSISVTPSLYEFPEEFGRTWHKYKQGTYFLPNDNQEQDRLDLEHAITLKVFEDKLNFAPIEKVHRVLDVGTGTGIWAIEFAEQHPEADVLGTDLSPIQPEFVPSNCRFEVDDCEDDWIFSYPFDFIHARYLCSFLKEPPRLMASLYRNLNPGSWVEIHEAVIQYNCIDASLDGTALEKWNGYIRDGISRLGRDVFAPFRCREYLLDAGFENVTQKKFVVPTSPWAKGHDEKVLGAMQMKSSLEGISGMTLWVFTKGLEWTREDVELFLVDVRKDLADRRIHAYLTM